MKVDFLRDGLLEVSKESSAQDSDATSPSAPTQGSEISPDLSRGPCRLCNERPALEECLQCHQAVCLEDLWVMLRLCRGCLSEEQMREAQALSKRPRPDLDIKWVED